MRRLCCRLIGVRGGVGLARSLLEQPLEPDPHDENAPNWCKRGKCRDMGVPREDVCCGQQRCVTIFENFHLLCTEHTVLTVAINNRADIYADPIVYNVSRYKKAAYRQYILWVYGSLGPTPKNRPGTHCTHMRVINTFNVGIPTFRYTFRVRPLRVTSHRITLRYVSVHYTCAMACLQPSGFDSTLLRPPTARDACSEAKARAGSLYQVRI